MQRTLKQYVLLEQLGSTGLGTVYRATGPLQEGEVALKVLRPYLSADEELLERFSKKMELLTKLRHPNIVPVYSKESEGDVHWITMQYVSWPTLRQWLQQPIPAAQAVAILKQVVEAVEAAQAKGITHGDIKPGNIFLDPETGQVVLSDFGMAMLGEGVPVGMRTSLKTPLPTYMAPERAQGSPPDPRSEVYSLGVLLFDMLTGTAPFNALDRATVLVAQLTTPPPLASSVNADVPQRLDAVITKALTPHRDLRYESPGEFLRAILAEAPVDETTPLLFALPEKGDPQQRLPGMEGVEVAPAQEDENGPVVICTVCGQSNASRAKWCSVCWSVLQRVAVEEGSEVLTIEERRRRQRRRTILRRVILATVLLAVGTYSTVRILDITPPPPAPSSMLTAESGPGEWAMVNRNLSGPAPILGESTSFSGRVKWTFETSDRLESVPAVKEGRVYLTTIDKRVVALDAATGDLIWQYDSPAIIKSSPAVAEDMLYFGSYESKVIALSTETGEMQWEFETGNLVVGSPIVSDGTVYIGAHDNKIYALDALTGKKRWSSSNDEAIANTPALYDDMLVVSSLDGKVRTYDVDTGKRRYTFRGLGQAVLGSPMVSEGHIYVPFRNGFLYSINVKEKEILFGSRWYRLKIQLYVWGMMGSPGHPRGVEWATWVGGSLMTTPAADDTKVYVSTLEGRVHARDKLTGKRLWVFKSDARGFSTPTLLEGLLLVSDSEGKVHALSTEDGTEQWVLDVADDALSTPVVAGGTIYLTSRAGVLYAVE